MIPEESREKFQAVIADLRSAFGEWAAAKAEQFEQLLDLGWSGQHEDMTVFLSDLEQECKRRLRDTDHVHSDISSTTGAMELEEMHEKLAEMKPIWDKLRAEGVPIDRRPLATDVPWTIQFQFQAENDPTGKDMGWWRAHQNDALQVECGFRPKPQQEAGSVPIATAAPKTAPAFEHGWRTEPAPGVESARIWQLQLSLFPVTSREFCERMGLNWMGACQLHADGWLSFDPRNVPTLNEAQEAELQLVGPLVVAGCDAEMLARLLNGLRRPYQYRPGSIYLDWGDACWRLLPVAEEPDPLQVFADWLDSLKESGDREQLEDIARDVAAALKSLPREAPEPDAP